MSAEPVAVDLRATEARARRAYERSMLRLGLVRGAVVGALVAVLAGVGLVESAPAAWIAGVFVVWTLLGWRGSLWWRGALGGLVAGLGGLLLPMSVLRPCCATMTTATSCSMPQACAAAGALLGVVVAATMPRARTVSEWGKASAGALVAVGSIVSCRCATMLLGETVGLLGGILATAAGIAAARAWWSGRASGWGR